jgi:hypothetical protein
MAEMELATLHQRSCCRLFQLRRGGSGQRPRFTRAGGQVDPGEVRRTWHALCPAHVMSFFGTWNKSCEPRVSYNGKKRDSFHLRLRSSSSPLSSSSSYDRTHVAGYLPPDGHWFRQAQGAGLARFPSAGRQLGVVFSLQLPQSLPAAADPLLGNRAMASRSTTLRGTRRATPGG